MKKLILCSILSILFFNAYSQDTTCTYFTTNNRVLEFDYYTSKIISIEQQISKYYEIKIKYGDVLCLQLFDKKNRFRTVIITYFDGSTYKEVLDSKDNIYYSPKGAAKVSVGRSKMLKI